jgi:hypothetical protein
MGAQFGVGWPLDCHLHFMQKSILFRAKNTL